jgi:hypothetical protein
MTEEQIKAFRAVRQAWCRQISDQHVPENYYFTSLLRLYSEAAIHEAVFFTAKFVRGCGRPQGGHPRRRDPLLRSDGEKHPAGAGRSGANSRERCRVNAMRPRCDSPKRPCMPRVLSEYGLPRPKCEGCRQTFRGAEPNPAPRAVLTAWGALTAQLLLEGKVLGSWISN